MHLFVVPLGIDLRELGVSLLVTDQLVMKGTCSAAGWSQTASGYSCAFHGRPFDLETKVLFAGCARKLGPLLAEGGQVERLISDALVRASAPPLGDGGISVRTVGALIYADGERVDETFAMLHGMVSRDARMRAILAISEPAGRLGRIALCRNTLLGEALNRLADDGLLVTLDLDCRLDVASLFALLPTRARHWARFDLLTANSQPYRDLWALRSRRLGVDYDCWVDERTMAARGSCLRYRISIDPAAPAIAVDSAFNGASILRIGAVRGHNATHCRYPDPASTADSAPGLFQLTSSHVGSHDQDGRGGDSARIRVARIDHRQADSRRVHVDAMSGVSRNAHGNASSPKPPMNLPTMKPPRAVTEHVPLANCLREHGVRIGIAPSLITSCPCGAFCGDLQRFFYRVHVFANGSLTVRDHRKRRPFTTAQWKQFVGPMCEAAAEATGGGDELWPAALPVTAASVARKTSELYPEMKERVPPATAPTALC